MVHTFTLRHAPAYGAVSMAAQPEPGLVSNVPNGANGAMDLVMRTDQATDYIRSRRLVCTRAHFPQH